MSTCTPCKYRGVLYCLHPQLPSKYLAVALDPKQIPSWCPKGKKVITDKSGQDWYIASDQDIAVTPCPACGKPLKVSPVKTQPKVKHVIFRSPEGRVRAAFDLDALPSMPVQCFFCGYSEEGGSK